MLLSKIPVLDKGFVALIDSCNNSEKLRALNQEFFGGKASLEELGSMTVVIKCPLFVQLTLSKFNFKVINATVNSEPESYLPNAGEIGSRDRSTNEVISDDIARTTAALLINPKSYQADGCDRFLSQVITPINIYTTLIVSGQYDEWNKYISQKNTPGPIKSYIEAMRQILEVEWK
jgi:hypothetical protein